MSCDTNGTSEALPQPPAAKPLRFGPPPEIPAADGDISPKSIQGADNRTPVGNTALSPCSGICKLDVSGSAGTSHGSGFLITDRWVVTAAHVIVDAGGAPRVRATLVDGSARGGGFLLHPNYLQTGDDGHDIALIKLTAAAGPEFYKFQGYPFDDAFLTAFANRRNLATVAGYPVSAGGAMLGGQGVLTAHSDRVLEHMVDTTKGQSGAPLFFSASAATWVLGVHGHGDITDVARPGVTNKAARLSPGVLGWIHSAITHL